MDFLRLRTEPFGMPVAGHLNSRMRIEEERGDLLIDILKNLPQQGQYVRVNMPDEKEEGEGKSESESESEEAKQRKKRKKQKKEERKNELKIERKCRSMRKRMKKKKGERKVKRRIGG